MAFARALSLWCLLTFYITQVLCQGQITIDYPSGGETFALGDFVEVSFVYLIPGSYTFTITMYQRNFNGTDISGQWNTTQSANSSSFTATHMCEITRRIGNTLPIADNAATPYYVVVSANNMDANHGTSRDFTIRTPTLCPTYWYSDGNTKQGVMTYHGCSLESAGNWGALAAEPTSMAKVSGLVGLVGLAVAYLL